MVNGRVYSWENIVINVPGLEEITIAEISYDFRQEAELIYRRGGAPYGYGTGGRKNMVEVVMGHEDYNALLVWYKREGETLSRLLLDRITVPHANKDQDTIADVLDKVILNKHSFSAKQGGKENTVSLGDLAYRDGKLDDVNF